MSEISTEFEAVLGDNNKVESELDIVIGDNALQASDLELELPPVVYTELALSLPESFPGSSATLLSSLVQSQEQIGTETELALGQHAQKIGALMLSILKFGLKASSLRLAIPRGGNVKSGLLSLRLVAQIYKEKAAQLLLTLQDREGDKSTKLELIVGPTDKQYNRWFRSWY